jgi:hypothetical protein
VILNNIDYKQKITSLFKDPSYTRLAMDDTESIERKTTLLLKKFTPTEDRNQQLRPPGSRPSGLYICIKGVPLRPIATLALLPTNSPSTS